MKKELGMPFINSDWISLFSDYSYGWKRFVAYQRGEDDYWPWSFTSYILLNWIELYHILSVSRHLKKMLRVKNNAKSWEKVWRILAMVLAETIVGKISMGLLLHEQRAKQARDCQGLCCYIVPLWPGVEKRFSNTLSYFY